MSSKWAHWTQSKLCLVTQLFPFPEEKEQRPAVEKKKNGTYFLPCGQWLINCKGTREANIRGRPLDFWEGGGVWVISVKHILQTNFEGKISCEEIPEEKKNILHWKKLPLMAYKLCWKKNILHHYMSGKKIPEVWEKKILPKPYHLYPAQKSNCQPLS